MNFYKSCFPQLLLITWPKNAQACPHSVMKLGSSAVLGLLPVKLARLTGALNALPQPESPP